MLRSIVIIAGVVVVVLLGVYALSAQLANHNISSSSATSQANSSSAPIPTLAASPTPSPTPTPTPLPKPGTVLCQPKADAWPQNGAWQAVGTEYVYRQGGSSPP